MQQENEYKDKILATVSHDVKSPLNSIVNTSLSLKNNLSLEEISMKQEIIINNANLALFLIHDILDKSMIKQGKLRINKEVFSLLQTFRFIENIFHQ
jgi:signal transduction histidine kinase